MRCWILDSESDPVYANLALSFPADEFLVLDWSDVKCNPLHGPPGIPAEVWDEQFKRILCETCFVREGGSSMVSVLLNRCREEQQGRPVALRHVYQKLIELRYRLIERGREYTYYETLKNRLEGLLEISMFKCLVGFDWAKLTSKNVLFRLRGLGTSDYEFLANYLLCFLASYMQPGLGSVPKLFIVLEETHRLTYLQRLRRTDSAEPIILDMVRSLGKRGVSLVFVDQVPYALPVEILANAGFRVVFGTIEGRNLSTLQQSLSLSYDQRAFLSHLPERVCVVQYNNPNFPEPFPVVVDEFPLREDIDSEIAQRRSASRSELSYVPVEKLEPTPKRTSETTNQSPPLVSKPARDYFVEVSKDQFSPVSRRDGSLGIPAGSGNALRRELQEAGLITVELVDTYGKSRKIRNARITERGYAVLREMDIRCERPRGKGGWEHIYHQDSIARWAPLNGYRASIEHFHDGKSVDVCLEKGGVRIAVEIFCKGLHKELKNLHDLQSGYPEIWFCVKDSDEIRRLQELISLVFREEAKEVLARVKFKLLGHFQDALALHEKSRRAL